VWKRAPVSDSRTALGAGEVEVNRCMACIVSVGVLAGSAFAQSSVVLNPRTTLGLLNQRIPEVIFEDTPFNQVMEWLQETQQLNLVVRWEILTNAGIDRDKPITLKVKNVRLSQALWMIMNEAGGPDLKLAYRASGNLLVVSTAENLGQEMVVRTYDVSDLLIRVERFYGPAIDLSQAGQQQGQGGGGQSLFQQGQDQNRDRDQNDRQGMGTSPEMDRLIDLITKTIEPESWASNNGNGTIQAFRNTLVVRNSILVHQRLGGYLEEPD
jgi:hypothetical protein